MESEEKLIGDWAAIRRVSWISVVNPLRWRHTWTEWVRVDKEQASFSPMELRNQRKVLGNQMTASLILFMLALGIITVVMGNLYAYFIS